MSAVQRKKILLLETAVQPVKREKIESYLTSFKTKIKDLLGLEIVRKENDLLYQFFFVY